MKERLVKTLKLASRDDKNEEDSLAKAVREDLSMSREELREAASLTLRWLLHAYGDLSISTIDRFNLKVIRSFARDLKLPLNFEIEMQQVQLLERVINSMLSNIGHNPSVDKAILDYSRWKISEGKNWKIETDLLKSSKRLYDDNAQDLLNKIQQLTTNEYLELIQRLRTAIGNFESKLQQIAKQAIDLIEQPSLSYDDFHYKKAGAINFYYKIYNGDYDAGGARISAAIENESFVANKTNNQDLVEQITPELIRLYHEIKGVLEKDLEKYISWKHLSTQLPTQALMANIHSEIEELKKDEQLLNISDFNQQISKVVQTEPLPFIYERIGERYYHIMIDEFQDTSILQFQNLLPLLDESLANGNMSLIVGDAKQSIYRFRGGEVEQFSQMPNIQHKKFKEGFNPERLSSLIRNYHPQELNYNFRSSRKIIEFNNLFFDCLGENYPINDRNLEIFKSHKQEIPAHADDDGYVDLRIMEREEDGEKLHLNEMLSIIEELKGRGYAYEDMAVLCQSNKQIREAAEFLNEKNVPLLTSEALKVESSPKVEFLLSLMRLQLNSDDLASRLFIFDYLFEEAYLNGEKSELQMCFVSKSVKGFNILFNALDFEVSIDRKSNENLLQWFERQIRDFKLADEYDLYLQFFEEKVLEFQERNHGGTEEFLNFWEERSKDVNVDLLESGDAVQMLSIHKSKGLEFPIVIMPFLSGKVEPSRSNLWVDELPEPAEELELALLKGSNELLKSTFKDDFERELIKAEGDLLNMLYVAFTRAEKELYLISIPPTESKSQLSVPILLNDLKQKLEQLEGEHYCYGKPSTKVLEEEVRTLESDQINLKKYHSSSWNDKVNLSLEMRTQWTDNADEMDSRKYGSLLHEILARIYTIADIEPTLSAFWHAGRITEVEKNELLDQLSHIINSEELKAYFSQSVKIKNEATLITEDGELLRPDRLIFFPDRVVVLDYKSGAEKSEHVQQLENYAKEVAKISKQPVEAKLYYLQSREVKIVA